MKAQNNTADLLSKKIQSYHAAHIREKTFIHTDKNNYVTGEVMWFKAYHMNAATQRPATVSKVLYVEVVDGAGKPVLQSKIALDEGKGNGSLFLPLTLETGNYTLRAYTSWMKNFSPEFYFQKIIPVVNSMKVLPDFAAVQPAAFFIRFFPEGSHALVAGIPSKVAFQGTDGAGKGVAFSGYVVSDAADTVLRFAPLHRGMGHFTFTPQAGRTYKAVVTTHDNHSIVQDLPPVLPVGYQLQLQHAGNEISLTAQATADVGNAMILIAHAQQKVHSVRTIAGKQGSIVYSIAGLPEGITQFTLFDNAGAPIAERLFFKKPAAGSVIQLQTNHQSYNKRAAVLTQIEAKGDAPDLSLSVYRTTEKEPQEEDIQSWYWLGSELKGNIEAPGYYFSDSATQEATDLLMLTHGWRSFTWRDVLEDKKPVIRFAPEYNGHIISGIVRNQKTGRPAQGVTTYLSLPGNHYKFATALSDAAGLVHFDIKDFYGPAGLVLQTLDSGNQVSLLSPFTEEPLVSGQAFRLAGYNRDQLSDQSVAMQVQHWFHADSLKKFMVPSMDTLPFFGYPDQRYDLDLYKRFPTIEEVLREYVREINVRNRDGKKEMAVVDWVNRQVFPAPPLVMVDGIAVLDQDRIFAYDPVKVKKLEVVTDRFYSGVNIFDGIANFITYTGDYKDLPLGPTAVIVDYEGLQLQRQFYAPVYETEQQRTSRIPDLRELLFWTPDLPLNQQGTANLTFYTSDQPGHYLMVVQGMSNGKPVVGYQWIEVK